MPADFRNQKVAATLVCIFAAGAATGALGMRLALNDRLHRVAAVAIAPVRSAGIPGARDTVLARYQTELQLTEEQSQMMRLVLEDYWRYYINLQDQLDDMRAMGKDRIVELLDAQQRQRFEKLSSEQQALPAKSDLPEK